jgi:hypothetical protein
MVTSTKRAPAKKASTVKAKKAPAADHRFFLTPDQLINVFNQHQVDCNN